MSCGLPYSVMLPVQKRRLLDYEVRASWWAHWISWQWAQCIAGSYFAWKIERKYARYERSLDAWAKMQK